jgi:hypothetical protein
VGKLCENYILLDEDMEESLVWMKNIKNGSFTAKLGYKSWTEFHFWEKKIGAGVKCGNSMPCLDAIFCCSFL